MPSRPLRCLTLNTWKGEGDYPARLRAMGAGLTALAPDVVLLQECFRTTDGEADTARDLGAALGLTVAYAPARTKRRRWGNRAAPSESGHAILIRGPVDWSERLALSTDDAGGERIALLAAARLGEGIRVLAACLHLSHLRDDRDRRRQQLEAVLAHPRWTAGADLRILGGDCNATADAPELTWLATHPEWTVRRVSPSLPTHPMPPQKGSAGRCIDHLFLVTPLGDRPATILRSEVALTAPHAGTWPSDHAAVWIDALPAPADAPTQATDP